MKTIIIAALFLVSPLLSAATYLDPVEQLSEAIVKAAQEDHDVAIFVLVKDCKVFGIHPQALKKTPQVSQMALMLTQRGNPIRTPIKAFDELEEKFNLKIVFRQVRDSNIRGTALCPSWDLLRDVWHKDTPYKPDNAVVGISA